MRLLPRYFSDQPHRRPAAVGARATHLSDVEWGADQWAAAQIYVAKADALDRGALPHWASRPPTD